MYVKQILESYLVIVVMQTEMKVYLLLWKFQVLKKKNQTSGTIHEYVCGMDYFKGQIFGLGPHVRLSSFSQ